MEGFFGVLYGQTIFKFLYGLKTPRSSVHVSLLGVEDL